MTISVWRYSHLALAVSSFLFIALAAITGCILAFEPLSQKALPYRTDNFDQITAAQFIEVAKSNFEEVIDVTVDANQFVIVKGITAEGSDTTAYVNARSGKMLGTPKKTSEFFQWVTNLHRSLFLHELGRAIMGITAFLLLLIAVSGTMLIIQRQRGIKRFFKKIAKDNFAQYYHVILGRLSLIPIIIIAGTGAWLTYTKLMPGTDDKVKHKVDFEKLQSNPVKAPGEFAVFKKIKLSDVRSIEFPFSEDVEDYYTLKLTDRELVVNQITGDVLSEVFYPGKYLFTNLSLDLHTGRTNAIWAVILAVASANILFFIYSGFVIMLKRRSGRIKNKYSAAESRFVILVGSENGNTFNFARAIHEQLIKSGEKSYITELNNYKVFDKAEHLLVLTATYGLGEAPVNARQFIALLSKYKQPNKVQFSVLGFGSRSYLDFCRFAFDVNNALTEQDWAKPLIDVHTVNDRSPVEFGQWATLWLQCVDMPLQLPQDIFQQHIKRRQTFAVVDKTVIEHQGETFLISLKPTRNVRFTSGDLLAIYPANDHRERLYSISKMNGQVQLSVKLHNGGLGSGYLNSLKPGDSIRANIQLNPHFRFPVKSQPVILISNGTGIAPFLGMIDGNRKKIPCYLYCGFKSQSSYNIYQDIINRNLNENKLNKVNVAYSREGKMQYVKHLLENDALLIACTLQSGGTIMICGSLSMQKDVITLLEKICHDNNQQDLSYYQSHGQVLTDCY